VTQQKQPHQSYIDNQENIMTAVEISWRNENVQQLVDEISRWAESGRTVIGFRLRCSRSASSTLLVVSQAREVEQPGTASDWLQLHM
jgi:hypothetical protein